MRLTHSTLSAQLRALEEHFGTRLFERRGKRLVLTPFGTEAAGYAADIFRLGRELYDVAQGRAAPGRDLIRVGVARDPAQAVPLQGSYTGAAEDFLGMQVWVEVTAGRSRRSANGAPG